MKYDPLTRMLHLAVAAGISMQMLTSLVMVTPKPGRAPNDWFELHETVGVALLGVVAVYWIWIVFRTLRRGEALVILPWFSRERLVALRDDIVETLREVRQMRLPVESGTRPLPGAVQGLGLLCALFMAATGTTLAIGMGPDVPMPPTLHAVKELHETVAPLMWAYLIGHPLLGLLHQLAGHGTLTRMFGLRS